MTVRWTLIAVLVILALMATWLLWHAKPGSSPTSVDSTAGTSETVAVPATPETVRSALEPKADAPVPSPAVENVPAAEKPLTPPGGPGTLTIHVVSGATGESVPAIVVRISQPPLHEPQYVVTDRDGRATVGGLSAAEARVVVRNEPRMPPKGRIDRETVESIRDYLTAVPQGQEVELVMRTRDYLSGVVLGPDESPLPDVGVACATADGQFLVEYTGAEGRFTALVPAREPIELHLSGHYLGTDTSRRLTLDDRTRQLYRGELRGVVAPSSDLVLHARAPRDAEVIVHDPDGNPVEGATILLRSRWMWSTMEVGTTEAGGRAEMRLPDDEVMLTARPSPDGGSAWIESRRLRVTPAGRPLELSLRRSVPLSILVLDPRGNAVWGDAVFVSAEGEPGGRGVTDANGRFQMSAADDVSYTVRVEHFEDREFNTEVTGVRADGRDAIVHLVHK